MTEALARKDEKLECSNEVLKYIEKITQLEKLNCVLPNFGKKINQLGKRQKNKNNKGTKE